MNKQKIVLFYYCNEQKKDIDMNYSNESVYDFLWEECRYYPGLLELYGNGIAIRTEDASFWEELSEELDCFRICDNCGKPMIEGYVIDGCATYCSDECLKTTLLDEDFLTLYDNGSSDTYYTTWYENSKTYNKQR